MTVASNAIALVCLFLTVYARSGLASLVKTCKWDGTLYELHDRPDVDYPSGWKNACKIRGSHSLVINDVVEAAAMTFFPSVRLNVIRPKLWEENSEPILIDLISPDILYKNLGVDCATFNDTGLINEGCNADYFVCELDNDPTNEQDCVEEREKPLGCDGIEYNEHCYLVPSTTSKTWMQAQATCMKLGGFLATISSQDEMNVLQALTEDDTNKIAWIGFWRESADVLEWTIDEVPFNYGSLLSNPPWAPFQPGNAGVDLLRNCIGFTGPSAAWYSYQCQILHTLTGIGYSVCEYEVSQGQNDGDLFVGEDLVLSGELFVNGNLTLAEGAALVVANGQASVIISGCIFGTLVVNAPQNSTSTLQISHGPNCTGTAPQLDVKPKQCSTVEAVEGGFLFTMTPNTDSCGRVQLDEDNWQLVAHVLIAIVAILLLLLVIMLVCCLYYRRALKIDDLHQTDVENTIDLVRPDKASNGDSDSDTLDISEVNPVLQKFENEKPKTPEVVSKGLRLGKKKRSMFRENLIDIKQITIMKKIGDGNTGVVFLGLWREQQVAIKRNKVTNIKEMKNFLSEVEITCSLPRHNNITRTMGVSLKEGNPVLVLEYIPDGTLRHLYKTRKTHLTLAELFPLLSGVVDGMAFLHANKVIHRDLACRNILLKGTTPKICDFGMSRRDKGLNETTAGTGPIRWMAPEAIGDRTYSTASDVWSFAVCVWELIHRDDKPYGTQKDIAVKIMDQGIHPEVTRTDIPELVKLLEKCWEVEPSDRPSFLQIRKIIDTGDIFP